jgi:PAS domain S-box-containing protein
MTLSLRIKVSVFIAVVVLVITAVSTALFFSAQKAAIEREVTVRGIALAEALSRSVDEGIAQENLNLIKQVEKIVHTKDVVLAQVFTTLWLPIAAVPVADLNVPPQNAVVAFYAAQKGERDPYTINEGRWIDVYSPVYFEPPDVRLPKKVLLGFVRLRIATREITLSTTKTAVKNSIASALLALIAILVLYGLMGRYVLRPILLLHRSIARHREGDFSETITGASGGELGELTEEFNAMSRALREREERLAQEKERLSVTLRSIGDAVIVADTQGTVTLLNKVAELHTGWSAADAVGRPLAEVFHIINEKTRERCESPAQKVMVSGVIAGLANHTALVRKDGTEIIIEDSAAPIRDRESRIVGVVLVFRDTTDKRRMEEELLKVEKLESVGVLAGGLAHDFNNLLTAIVGNISMAKMYIDARNKAYDRLAEAETASRRATDLTYQLLTFSRGGEPVRQATSIVEIIRDSAKFTLSGTAVAFDLVAAEGVWSVDVDAGQMSQVFNNLFLNAAQAMPGGGRVTAAVDNVMLPEGSVPSLREGAYVAITISDTGPGISAEHLPRIFDPYFTTKAKGSGLGLASVYSIVKRHGGHVTVESRPGRGASFHLYLPAARAKAAATGLEAETIARGGGRVMVMDDEQIIRDIAAEMLRTLGYEVETVPNGDEAITQYRRAMEAGHPFDVVVMDLTVPGGMGGKETIRRLKEIDPLVKGIVSSGYSTDPVMAEHGAYGFSGVVTKPYSIEQLSRTLRKVLER